MSQIGQTVCKQMTDAKLSFYIAILFQAIQFSQTVLFQTIQFSISTFSMSKTVLFQIIQFSISTQFKCQNSSISSNSV